SLNPTTGTVTTLYSFKGDQRHHAGDGMAHGASLIEVNGVLYGTTLKGGAYDVINYGDGTVFSVNPKTREEKLLHSFGAYAGDGVEPYAALINVSGTLYGTTVNGGSSANGTVFAIDPNTGAETIAYSFAGGADGKGPYTGLIELNGKLYGTTAYGGNAAC